MKVSKIHEVLFLSKKNIPWDDVEKYLRKYVGKSYLIEETKETINIGSRFPDEYASSKDTARLRGALAKAKANAATIIDQLICNSTNRRTAENMEEKHRFDAKYGWNRYDSWFLLPVKEEGNTEIRWNLYKGTIIVRRNDQGLFLHDIINIKKEARTPFESQEM